MKPLIFLICNKDRVHEIFPKAATDVFCKIHTIFCKKGFVKNFANFTRRHLCWSFFNKVACLGLQLY